MENTEWRLLIRRNIRKLAAILFSVFLGACAGTQKAQESAPEADIGEIQIKEFLLAPNDEIMISVYKHEDLATTTRISPGGMIFFPMVGEIDVKGKSLRELRQIITEGLSQYKDQVILPGDKISISVFLHEEYNRTFLVPSDGYIFFPYVGDIHAESMSLRELRAIISEGLVDYVVDPQVMIDIVDLSNPVRIVDPQVSIEVVSFKGQRVFVLGEVVAPGVYLVDGQMTLIEVIAMAGGFTNDANLNGVMLVRSEGAGKRPKPKLIAVEKYLKEGEIENNPIVQTGDVIYVHSSFIANVDRFFGHFSRIISPILDIERGYWIGQNIIEGPQRSTSIVP